MVLGLGRKSITFVCVYCFLNVGLFSETLQRLSFNDYLNSAIDASIDLQISKQKIKLQKAVYQQSFSNFLPSLSLNMRSHQNDYQVKGRDPLVDIKLLNERLAVFPVAPSPYSSQLALQLNQKLYAGFRYLSALAIKSRETRKAEIYYQKQFQILGQNITELYGATVLAWNQSRFAVQKQHLYEQRQRLMSTKMSEGLVTEKMLKDSLIILETLKDESNMASNLFLITQQRLLSESGLKLTAVRFDWQAKAASFYESNLARIKMIIQQSQSLQQQLLAQDFYISKKRVTYFQSFYHPEIHLELGLNYFDSADRLGAAMDDFKRGDAYWTVRLSYPLFEGFKNKAAVEQAVIEKEIIQLEQKRLLQSENIQKKRLLADCETALLQLKQKDRQLFQLKTAYSESLNQLNSRLENKLNLIDKQVAMIEMQQRYVDAVVDFELKMAKLAFVLDIDIPVFRSSMDEV